jgi:acetoin utilization deacetylase AcuC-like enzyme
LIQERLVRKVGIIDCDAHWFDGVVDIVDTLELYDVIKAWSFGGEFGRGRNFRQADLLSQLADTLSSMKADGVGLIIYQAGADPHQNDPLGGLMTSAEMRERDAFVFKECMAHGMPVVFDFSGGYQRDANGGIEPVLELHRATAEEAIRALAGARSTTKKWIRMIDTTAQSLGKGIAIIGGVRAPRKPKQR